MAANRARRTRVVLESAHRQEAEKRPIVAIKVGGSLLTSLRLFDRLNWLIAQREACRPIIICGGGAAADIVRRWQKTFGTSEEAAHHLALAAMSFNERLLLSAMPAGKSARNFAELDQLWEEGRIPVLRTMLYINEVDPNLNEPMPYDWNFTSDSIAAWCSHVAGADELILAKSADLPDGCSLDQAREQGLVDRNFGTHRCPETVSWINLRSDQPRLTRWWPEPNWE